MKAAIYVRVSTEDQAREGYSIPAQINVLTQFSIACGYELGKVYEDQGISGKNIKDRPGLNQLLDDAKENKFQIVVVWKLSRMSRSLLDLLSIVDVFTQHGISFQSFSEKFDTSTPMGKMLLQMLGSIAEFERNTIVENVKLGMDERFKQGYPKGSIPFGYEYSGKDIVINEKKAAAVRYAFEYYENTSSTRPISDIVEYLNDNGISTLRGGKWVNQAVNTMLKNKFYAGYVRTGLLSHGRKSDKYQEVKGTHETIIHEDLFNSVYSKIVNKNYKIDRFSDNTLVLSGIIKCPNCGLTLIGSQATQSYKTRSGEERVYPRNLYRCDGKYHKSNGCKGYTISQNVIEPVVLGKVFDGVDILKEVIEEARNVKEPISKPDNTKALQKELTRLKHAKNNYIKLFESGAIKDMNEFSGRYNEINSQIKEIEDTIKNEKSKKADDTRADIDQIITHIKTLKSIYDKMTYAERKEGLRILIKEIEVTPGHKLKSIKLIDDIIL